MRPQLLASAAEQNASTFLDAKRMLGGGGGGGGTV